MIAGTIARRRQLFVSKHVRLREATLALQSKQQNSSLSAETPTLARRFRLYTLAMYLMIPVILYRLLVRGIRAPAYLLRWRERFGFFGTPRLKNSIWIHAVSVGEFNAAIPLIRALMTRYPKQPFVVTTITPTGSDRVVSVFGEQVFHVYLPYDLPAAIRRFLERTRPALAVIMETELWPNLFRNCRNRDIPIVVANARLSERSMRGYRPFGSLASAAVNCASRIAAQTQTDAERIRQVGAAESKVSVVGSLKFDLEPDAELLPQGQTTRKKWGSDRFVWIAASTHEDDEIPMFEAFKALLAEDPTALLIIVPRHPERFNRVVARCRQLGYLTHQRTKDHEANSATQCFVVDTMGEMMRYYATADVAFVGGSLANIGGHNVLEPATLGIPVLVGPNTFNFAEITALLLERGGAARVFDAQTLTDELLTLYRDPKLRRSVGRAGLRVVAANRGAVERTMLLIHEAISEAENPKQALLAATEATG